MLRDAWQKRQPLRVLLYSQILTLNVSVLWSLRVAHIFHAPNFKMADDSSYIPPVHQEIYFSGRSSQPACPTPRCGHYIDVHLAFLLYNMPV